MTIIVGAGLAGLTCAKVLHEADAPFLLIEAANRVGGRVQTDETDGFRLDRGFQILPESYPAAKRHLDFGAFEARWFDSGALMWDAGDFFRVMHPFLHAEWLTLSALTPAFTIGDRMRLAALGASALAHSDEALLARCASPEDESTRDHLARLGFSEKMIRRFFEPFFGGVFLDDSLATSAGLFNYHLKKFATGRAMIPARGIGALPEQLARHLPADHVRLGARVAAVTDRGVTLETGEHFSADRVVLATDDGSTRRLLGYPSDTARPMLGVSTAYFASDRPLYTGPLLVLPAGKNRVVRHFIQITNVAPELAPADRHLISASILDHRGFDDETLLASAQAEIEEVFTEAGGSLTPLRLVKVPRALPAQPPGFAARISPPTAPKNVILAGDQIGPAGIQSAMASGERAAQIVLSV